MSTIHLPDTLVDQIAAAGVPTAAVDQFVQQAVQERLAEQQIEQADVHQAVDEFDALCDEAAVAATGTHLTRDQLHERD